MRQFKCESCGIEFESKKACKSRTPKYCSSKCYGKTMKMEKKCKLCDNQIENKSSSSLHNRIYCSKECQGKARKNIPLNDEWKKALSEGRKKSEKCKGKNLYNWKGGKETEKIRIKTAFYKRKKSLKKDLPIDFLQKIIQAQGNKCFFCEQDLKNYKAIEHLTPVSKGGDNDIFNLVYSCKSCNSQKGQNTLEEFSIKKNRFDWLDKFDIMYANEIS
jgi:5-methylcytosine-specific restriction endonuclease McrA